ncbi:unnamed protein product [Enterobius vermicularis]|uniref:GB1/RHD3-type G domain-containing protein n=1 Tax=Enterobius vermicularis TaxID=51028 RepID=A0A0N4UTG9_ENTVE|nr:unnamed protein product [Enterobius vermicularis]
MDECDSKSDHAITVIQKSTNGAWIPDVEALNKILKSKNIINKKVMVVSIAGPSRSGKSFLLNLILKAFYAAEQGRLEQEELTIATNNFGFRCRGGAKRETSGIALWSKPFLIRNQKDEEIAVLLMDTEGFFDAESTLEDCAKIFSYSSLLSSVQIYNLKEKIQLDFLKHVEVFGRYGSYATKNGQAKPFQSLLYLVRDWSCEDEYKYGFEGGEAYLRLFTNSLSKEVQRICRKIEECFESCSCFLMPHPGFSVAKAATISDSSTIEEDFLQMTRTLAKELFFGRFLGAKQILHRELTCKELCLSFILSGEVIFENVYSECTETYDNEIDTFVRSHKEASPGANLDELYELHTNMADNSSGPELLLELETIHDRTKCNVLKKFESWSVDPQCDNFQKFFQKLEEYIEDLSKCGATCTVASLEQLFELRSKGGVTDEGFSRIHENQEAASLRIIKEKLKMFADETPNSWIQSFQEKIQVVILHF